MLSVVAGLAKAAAGTKVLTGTRPARERAFPWPKRAVVVAVALLALLAFAALIPASQVPSAEHSSMGSTDYQPEAAAAPVSQPAAAPQMSEREALEAYEKLPLSFGATVPVFVLTFVLYLVVRFVADRLTRRQTVSETDRGVG